jgi:hypothetical protein
MSFADTMLDRFSQDAPVAVMTRALFANILSPTELDRIFKDCAERQYEGELLFSSVVHLLALAVTKQRSSVSAAYQQQKQEFAVSLTAVYDKLIGIELPVTRELVVRTAKKMSAVAEALGPLAPPLFASYETRVLDGFHLAGTEHRILETRTLRARPLPGQCLAVLDPQRQLIVDMYPCEDGHAQERRLLVELVEDLRSGLLWIMDRNFCTKMWLQEIDLNKSCFIVRHHAGMPLNLQGIRRCVGQIATGQLFEQEAIIEDNFGDKLRVRVITLVLKTATADGETTLVLLTNLPATFLATQIAEGYRNRWTIERAFGEITQSMHGEINTLSYPPAALLACAIAFVTYNMLSVVKSAIASVQGKEVREELSSYYLMSEISSTCVGMEIAIVDREWQTRFSEMSADDLAAALQEHARRVNLKRYQKHRRGEKKPPPKRTGPRGHLSTAQILASRTKEK